MSFPPYLPPRRVGMWPALQKGPRWRMCTFFIGLALPVVHLQLLQLYQAKDSTVMRRLAAFKTGLGGDRMKKLRQSLWGMSLDLLKGRTVHEGAGPWFHIRVALNALLHKVEEMGWEVVVMRGGWRVATGGPGSAGGQVVTQAIIGCWVQGAHGQLLREVAAGVQQAGHCAIQLLQQHLGGGHIFKRDVASSHFTGHDSHTAMSNLSS